MALLDFPKDWFHAKPEDGLIFENEKTPESCFSNESDMAKTSDSRIEDSPTERRKLELGKAKKPVYLNVDYTERQAVSDLGARWDARKERWFVPAGAYLSDFWEWLPDEVKYYSPYIYIVEAERACFKCGGKTKVIAFGIPEFESDDLPGDPLTGPEYERMAIIPRLPIMPRELRDWCEEKYGYRLAYSKTKKLSEYNNTCQHCGVLQGEFYLFEVSGPFFISSSADISDLKFYRVPIPYVVGHCGVFDDFGQEVLRYADAVHEDLDLGIFEPIMFPYW